MKKIDKKYIGSSPMKFLPAAAAIVGIGSQIYQGFAARRRRLDAQRRAGDFEKAAGEYLDQYRTEEYVNPYAGMQNVYEDMTINQQAAEFQREQAASQQAATLEQLRQVSTGGAGVAALATAMTREGARQARISSADIARQEQAIQSAQLREQARIEGLQRAGEERVRQQERQRAMNLYQLEAGRGAIAQQEANLARQQQYKAFGGAATSLIGGIAGGTFNDLIGGGVSNLTQNMQLTNELDITSGEFPTSPASGQFMDMSFSNPMGEPVVPTVSTGDPIVNTTGLTGMSFTNTIPNSPFGKKYGKKK